MSETSEKQTIAFALKKLEPIIEGYARSHMSQNGFAEGYYCAVTKAALKKSFELASFCATRKENVASYFLAPALRGVCEDIIDLKFIGQLTHPDRDKVVECLFQIQSHDLIKKQVEFFRAERPFQPVFDHLDASNHSGSHSSLKEISQRTGVWRYSHSRPIQTARFRAEKAGLLGFYDFYYAFTSEAVHFSPNALLRTGWGKSVPGERNPNEVSYSTNNFEVYYFDLVNFYSIHLFQKMIGELQSAINLPGELLAAADEIYLLTQDQLRWPEPITFEEYNIRGPGFLQRFFLKASAKH
jgi:hypothetical protein